MNKSIDAKSLQEKLEGLYKGVDMSAKQQDDKHLLRAEKHSLTMKERWENLSAEEKSDHSNRISAGLLTINQQTADQIWQQVWGPDRGTELYESLADKFNTTFLIVQGIALGSHPLCPVSQQECKDLTKQWQLKNSSIIGNRITDGKLTINQQTADQIWQQVWGPDRGTELYVNLAEKYNTTLNIVQSIAGGTHALSTITKNQWEENYIQWHNRYGYNKNIYIIRSPGNDLLDYYDHMNILRGTKTSKLSPSEIFDIRFRWEDKSTSAIKQYCLSKGINVDGAMYKTYATKTFGWLIDAPHQEWKFDSLPEMSNWMLEKINKPIDKVGGQWAWAYLQLGMIWMDRGAGFNGWSFITKEKY
jgi:hypothetical protein